MGRVVGRMTRSRGDVVVVVVAVVVVVVVVGAAVDLFLGNRDFIGIEIRSWLLLLLLLLLLLPVTAVVSASILFEFRNLSFWRRLPFSGCGCLGISENGMPRAMTAMMPYDDDDGAMAMVMAIAVRDDDDDVDLEIIRRRT